MRFYECAYCNVLYFQSNYVACIQGSATIVTAFQTLRMEVNLDLTTNRECYHIMFLLNQQNFQLYRQTESCDATNKALTDLL